MPSFVLSAPVLASCLAALLAGPVRLPAVPVPLPPPTGDGAAASGDRDPAADDAATALLDRLADATRDLRTFSAGLLWSEYDEQFDSVVTRRGRIAWRVDDAGVRTIGAFIDARLEGPLDGPFRRFDERRDWILQGRWLVERQYLRTPPEFMKRAIAGPGEVQDPFRLDGGLLPLPVGRSAKEILERFEASIAAAPGEKPILERLDPAKVAAVTLVPRPGSTHADDLERVTLFVDRASGLPVGVDLRGTNGKRSWVRLDDPVANAAVADDVLARLSIDPPAEGTGWRVVIE